MYLSSDVLGCDRLFHVFESRDLFLREKFESIKKKQLSSEGSAPLEKEEGEEIITVEDCFNDLTCSFGTDISWWVWFRVNCFGYNFLSILFKAH